MCSQPVLISTSHCITCVCLNMSETCEGFFFALDAGPICNEIWKKKKTCPSITFLYDVFFNKRVANVRLLVSAVLRVGLDPSFY